MYTLTESLLILGTTFGFFIFILVMAYLILRFFENRDNRDNRDLYEERDRLLRKLEKLKRPENE